MSTITPVTTNTPVTSIVHSPQGDIMAKAFAVLLMRYEGLKSDMDAQINDIEKTNQTKRLWNDKLTKLNLLMNQVASHGKPNTDTVAVVVKPDDMPYKEYKVTTTPDGTLTLEPTDKSQNNWITSEVTPIYGAPGADPEAAAKVEHLISTLEGAFRPSLSLHQATAITEQLRSLYAQRDQLKGNTLIGYELKVSAAMVTTQIDNVRTQIDSLNTFNDVAMLRLNDTFGKGNLVMEQLSKLLEGQNKTQNQMLQGW